MPYTFNPTNFNDALLFFQHTIFPLYLSKFSEYTGNNLVEKLLIILTEIREKILTNILKELENTNNPNILHEIDPFFQKQLITLIKWHTPQIKMARAFCPFYAQIRSIFSQSINNIPALYNYPLLGALRLLDPKNNKINIHASFKFLNYNPEHGLTIFNYPLKNDCQYTAILTALVIYYLATQYDANSLQLLPVIEQECRFGRYLSTLTEILRTYNYEYDPLGPDQPSCPAGVMIRLVKQCCYEPSITFISNIALIENIIKDIVRKTVANKFAAINNKKEATDLLKALDPTITSNLNSELLAIRYSLFDSENHEQNNKKFLELIIQELKLTKPNIAEDILLKLHNLQNNSSAMEIQLLSNTIQNPAFLCYGDITAMYAQKLESLVSACLIPDEAAQKLAVAIVEQNYLKDIFKSKFLLKTGYTLSDLAIIISSYKYNINAGESDTEFIARIKSDYYTEEERDYEEPEQIAGLNRIINQQLVRREEIIDFIANSILNKIQVYLANDSTPTLPPGRLSI